MISAPLIQECKQQNARAQRQLFDHLFPWLMGICNRYLTPTSAAEDAVMQSFLKIFQHMNSFQYTTEAAFKQWCKTIVVNTCLMELRKTQVLYAVSDITTDETVPNQALDKLELSYLYQLITTLPTGYRTVFNLYCVEGYTHAQISQLLGISEGTSKSQLAKARKILQSSITQNNSTYGTATQR